MGAPVPGTMSSVNWERLQDSSLIFGVPVIGYQLPDGSYLENTQLEPDILILNRPETVVTGTDLQLDPIKQQKGRCGPTVSSFFLVLWPSPSCKLIHIVEYFLRIS